MARIDFVKLSGRSRPGVPTGEGPPGGSGPGTGMIGSLLGTCPYSKKVDEDTEDESKSEKDKDEKDEDK